MLLFRLKNSDMMHCCVQPIPHLLKSLVIATLCTAALLVISDPAMDPLPLFKV